MIEWIKHIFYHWRMNRELKRLEKNGHIERDNETHFTIK
jgi:hypothetical protein